MSRKVFVKGHAYSLSPTQVIGQGGEAAIYKLNNKEVLKLYLEPSDPTYANSLTTQAAVRQRLTEHQLKLPAFPHSLPPRVISPRELAYSQASGGQVIGYTMTYLSNMELLLSFSDPRFRELHAITANDVVAIFRDLHATVEALHRAHVVIGDFNDLNVMVSDILTAYLIDADSMQFGPYPCRTFTNRFVDPLLCPPNALILNQPHNEDSDWYAFTTMLFQSLTYISPYFGGVHKPKTGLSYKNDARVLHRITVWSPSVVYPKVALPLTSLPDELLDLFSRFYERDERGIFPLKLLEDLRWTKCVQCGLWHARSICPACAAPGVVKQTIARRGTVSATRLFATKGQILFATYQRDELRYIYHEKTVYRREGGDIVLSGELDGELRIRLWNLTTVLAKGNTVVAIQPDGIRQHYETEAVGRLPIFDANAEHLYWLENGRLVRNSSLSPITIGMTLPKQTLFWVGARFGFGFYRAEGLTRGFVFSSTRPGLNDSVPLPALTGNLIDATCTFANHLAWFMVSIQVDGVIQHHCYVINDKAELVARSIAAQGDGSWLGDSIRGRLALGEYLYAATDTGIIRVILNGSTLMVDRQFPDTEPFVSSSTQLLPGKGGLIAVSSHEIVLLQIQ